MSFLDVISCGFGAIILLLVLNEVGEPIQLEQAKEDLDGQIRSMQEELYELRGTSTVLERELKARVEGMASSSSCMTSGRGCRFASALLQPVIFSATGLR